MRRSTPDHIRRLPGQGEPRPARERIRISRLLDLPGVELLEAVRTPHLYGLYFHERYALSLNEGPGGTVRYRGTTVDRRRGEIFLVEPGEVHRTLRTDWPLTFSVLFIEPWVFARSIDDEKPTHWRELVTISPVVGTSHGRAVEALTSPDSTPLQRQEALTAYIAVLAQECSERPVARTTARAPEHPRVKRARDLLLDQLASPVSLDQLSREVELNKFQLLRAFKERYGVPPSTYQRLARVSRARALLSADYRIADIAAECGFCDQSHFVRLFKQTVGLTPGDYRRATRK